MLRWHMGFLCGLAFVSGNLAMYFDPNPSLFTTSTWAWISGCAFGACLVGGHK